MCCKSNHEQPRRRAVRQLEALGYEVTVQPREGSRAAATASWMARLILTRPIGDIT